MSQSSTAQRRYSRSVMRVLAIVFILNVVVALAKLIYGIVTQSMSMSADGIHSFIDSLGNVVGLVGIFLASRPADKGHPYGHAKFELFASLVIGCFLLLAAYEVGSHAIERLVSGTTTVQVTPLSFVVMGATMAINICVTIYERAGSKRYASQILSADAMHTLSDVLTSAGVIVGLVLVQAGYQMADAIMALVVMVFIIFSAISVFRASLASLSDHAILPEEEIERMARELKGVIDIHAIRSRGTDAEVYCDLHILVEPSMSVLEAHELAENLEAAMKKRFPALKEVLIHIEPYGFDSDGYPNHGEGDI